MLGRTANGLYWMFRYIERAENIARLIDAGLRMSLTRSGTGDDDWDGVLESAGIASPFAFERREGGWDVSLAVVKRLGEGDGVLQGNTGSGTNRRMDGF